jgi:Arc/MetJ-type ribon-helix-helix transcriptional regulator
MEMRFTPEIERMVQRHLASGAYRSPQSVLTDALYALQELEAMRADDKQDAKRDAMAEDAKGTHALPIVQWLQVTAKPRIGLKELRRRLAKKLTGTMAGTVREGRDERN